MALLFMDGFDKYGPAGTSSTVVANAMAGEWSTITNASIVAPLSATGQALSSTAALTLTKNLSSSPSRIIGGCRFNCTLGQTAGIQFLDGASNQCGIQFTQTTGVINFRSGSFSGGTSLATYSSISGSTTHYLEWDITLGTSAAYNIYLDGVSIISGTGHTNGTANTTYSGITISASVSANILTIDDLYMFDTTGSTNNAVLLTSPRIETTFPTSDSSVQFSVGASVLGGTGARSTTDFSAAANGFYLRPFTPAVNCTLTTINILPGATSGSINVRPVVYPDNGSGAPTGTLMSSGSTVTGVTSGTTLALPLTTSQSLTAGTQYWLGYMTDTALTNAFVEYDGSNQGRTGTSTFSSGAPSSPPTLTTAQPTVQMWGTVTGVTVNNYEVNQSVPPSAVGLSDVTDSTVGHEDLYGFGSLSSLPSTIYAAAVKGFCYKSDAGARTISLRTKSSSTDSGGSLTGQTPATSLSWLSSNFETDPNTSAAWTLSNLNAATSGFKIDS